MGDGCVVCGVPYNFFSHFHSSSSSSSFSIEWLHFSLFHSFGLLLFYDSTVSFFFILQMNVYVCLGVLVSIKFVHLFFRLIFYHLYLCVCVFFGLLFRFVSFYFVFEHSDIIDEHVHSETCLHKHILKRNVHRPYICISV